MLQEWANQINEQRQSGLNITEWCEIRGMNRKTFYYRRKKLREELVDSLEGSDLPWLPIRDERKPQVVPVRKPKPEFAALPMLDTKGASITVRISGHAINIQNSAEATMVERVLRIVASL